MYVDTNQIFILFQIGIKYRVHDHAHDYARLLKRTGIPRAIRKIARAKHDILERTGILDGIHDLAYHKEHLIQDLKRGKAEFIHNLARDKAEFIHDVARGKAELIHDVVQGKAALINSEKLKEFFAFLHVLKKTYFSKQVQN